MVCEQLEKVIGVVVEVCLHENTPSNGPLVERRHLGLPFLVVFIFDKRSGFLNYKMGALTPSDNVQGLVLGKQVREVYELAILDFLKDSFREGRVGERVSVESPGW